MMTHRKLIKRKVNRSTWCNRLASNKALPVYDSCSIDTVTHETIAEVLAVWFRKPFVVECGKPVFHLSLTITWFSPISNIVKYVRLVKWRMSFARVKTTTPLSTRHSELRTERVPITIPCDTKFWRADSVSSSMPHYSRLKQTREEDIDVRKGWHSKGATLAFVYPINFKFFAHFLCSLVIWTTYEFVIYKYDHNRTEFRLES